MDIVEIITDLLKTGLPGLFASALAFFKPLLGVGLGFESWELAAQKTASFFGVILTLIIVYHYKLATRKEKYLMIRRNLYVFAGLLCADLVAKVLALDLARHDPYIYIFRDRLWPAIYFMLCVSVLSLVGFIGQLLR
jgi:hypothetical protein